MTHFPIRGDIVRYGFWVILIISGILFEFIAGVGSSSLHVLQAQAFLKGTLAVDQMAHDVVSVDGKFYVPFPAFPAILILPLVGLFGSIDTSLVALGLTLVNVWTITRLCQHFELESNAVIWVVMAFVIGSPYFSVLKFSSDVWYFSHVVAFTFSLLAIRLALVEKSIILASACIGAAILSRQLSVYTLPFVIACFFQGRTFDTRDFAVNILRSSVVIGMFLFVYCYMNWARFGNLFDTGYTYFNQDEFLAERIELHGLFHPAFIPFNFIHMFIQGPHIDFEGLVPIGMDPFGTALTFSSPFLFLMAFPKAVRRLEVVALVCTGVALVHMLMYFTNGYVQINGPRYALDFIPMLLLISIQYVKHREASWLFQSFTIYAVALNLLALLGVPVLDRLLSLVGIGGPA